MKEVFDVWCQVNIGIPKNSHSMYRHPAVKIGIPRKQLHVRVQNRVKVYRTVPSVRYARVRT